MDDFLKTLILQAPNFVGLIAALYVVTKFMVNPLIEENKRLTDAILEMVRGCVEREIAFTVNRQARGSETFSDERSGASQEEKV